MQVGVSIWYPSGSVDNPSVGFAFLQDVMMFDISDIEDKTIEVLI